MYIKEKINLGAKYTYEISNRYNTYVKVDLWRLFTSYKNEFINEY